MQCSCPDLARVGYICEGDWPCAKVGERTCAHVRHANIDQFVEGGKEKRINSIDGIPALMVSRQILVIRHINDYQVQKRTSGRTAIGFGVHTGGKGLYRGQGFRDTLGAKGRLGNSPRSRLSREEALLRPLRWLSFSSVIDAVEFCADECCGRQDTVIRLRR